MSDARASGGPVTAGAADADRTDPWLLLAGLFLLSASAAAYEIAPASVTPLVMDHLGVGEAAAGWLVSVMYGVAVVASVPVGVAVDRKGARVGVTLAAGTLLVAGAWGWLAAERGAYWSLVASRVLGGLSYVAIWNGGATLVGRAFGPGSRATAVGVFTAAAPAGFALGQFGGPIVATTVGWTAIFVVFGALAAVGVAPFWVASRGGDAVATGGDPPSRAEFRAALRTPAVWALAALGFLAFSLYLFLNSWMPTYLADRLGLSLSASGLVVALFPAVGIVARSASGAVSDRLFDRRRRPVAILAFLPTAPVIAGLALVGTPAAALALLVVAGFAIQLGIGSFFGTVRELVDPQVATTAVALLTSVSLLGAFAAPLLAGVAIERTGGFAVPFAGAAVLGALGLVLAWRLPEPAAARE